MGRNVDVLAFRGGIIGLVGRLFGWRLLRWLFLPFRSLYRGLFGLWSIRLGRLLFGFSRLSGAKLGCELGGAFGGGEVGGLWGFGCFSHSYFPSVSLVRVISMEIVSVRSSG